MPLAPTQDQHERRSYLVDRIGYVINQLRMEPNERAFYVPLVLDLARSMQRCAHRLEIVNISESIMARVIRHDYTIAMSLSRGMQAMVHEDNHPRLTH